LGREKLIQIDLAARRNLSSAPRTLRVRTSPLASKAFEAFPCINSFRASTEISG